MDQPLSNQGVTTPDPLPTNKPSTKMLPVIIILVLVLVGGYFLYQKAKSKTSTTEPEATHTSQGIPTVTDEQVSQIESGEDKSIKDKTFDINAGAFYFSPNKITVNVGDNVTFKIKNQGGIHDLVIDELNVKSAMVKASEETSVTFTASQPGSFVYYCSVPGHKEKGMWGTLEVK